MKARQVKAMADPQVEEDGWTASFTLVDSQSGRTKLSVSVEALDQIIANLETLAHRAAMERASKGAAMPFEPALIVTETTVFPDQIRVEEDQSKQMHLVFRRKGRSQIRAPLSREAYESYQAAMTTPPISQTRN